MIEVKILSRLLDYPQEDLWQNAQLIKDHITASLSFSPTVKAGLHTLIDGLVEQEAGANEFFAGRRLGGIRTAKVRE